VAAFVTLPDTLALPVWAAALDHSVTSRRKMPDQKLRGRTPDGISTGEFMSVEERLASAAARWAVEPGLKGFTGFQVGPADPLRNATGIQSAGTP
jgi:hypothetical protein